MPPIYNNDNIEIAINSTGLLINTANFSVSPSLEQIQTLGTLNYYDFQPNEGISHRVSMTYTPEISNEPNFNIAQGSKAQNIFLDRNFELSFAGISGNYYLQSYSFSVNELNEATANATYVCYGQLSGDYQSSSHVSYDATNLSGIPHAWTTYAEKSNGDSVSNIKSFEYSYENNLKPFYKLGSPYPHQVMSMGLKEKYDIIRDVYSSLSYSGAAVNQFYDGLYKFRCASVSGLLSTTELQDLTFTVNGGRVSNQSIDVSVNSNPLIKTTITKLYD